MAKRTRRFKHLIEEETPPQALEFAEERTAPLIRNILWGRGLPAIAIDCYLQGVRDAAQTFKEIQNTENRKEKGNGTVRTETDKG